MGKTLKNINLLFLIVSVVTLGLFTSCDDEGCIESVIAYLIGSLKAMGEDAPTIKSYSVWGVGQEKDSVLLSNQTSLKGIELLLNPNEEFTDFKFRFVVGTDTIIDYIKFSYKNRLYFLSIDCGCSTFYSIESIESGGAFIKDTEIVNSDVTNEKKVNFNLYY